MTHDHSSLSDVVVADPFVSEVRDLFMQMQFALAMTQTAIEVHLELREKERELSIAFDGPRVNDSQ